MTYLCVDFGSTWTKASVIDEAGQLLAGAAHPTTISTDVLDGYAHLVKGVAAKGFRVDEDRVLACSSAGGGLRIAVIGNEELVTSEAGRRVALSSGGHVVGVFSGGLAPQQVKALLDVKPDLIVLVGGTDGGNPSTLLDSARTLGAAGIDIPVLLAGNRDAVGEASALLGPVVHQIADNVVPEIGIFRPDAARNLARELFLTHVIGGKGLSASTEFAAMVKGATPDIVLRGVEALAAVAGDVVVVDVGGATTDVHSVVSVEYPEPREDETGELLGDDVVAQVPTTRSVEGDLGMRWSAPSTLATGESEGWVSGEAGLSEWVRSLTPSTLPTNQTQLGFDAALARTAIASALRRHAGHSEVQFVNGQRIVHQSGIDIREAHLVIGSGGALRADAVRGQRILEDAVALAQAPGRMLPRHFRTMVDVDYLLAPMGLLAAVNVDAVHNLAQHFHK